MTAMAAAVTTVLTSAVSGHQSELVTSIRPRILEAIQGSGNFGESGSSAIWTIDTLPPPLADMTSPPPLQAPRRTDITQLGPGRLAFVIDNLLTHHEADALAACTDAILGQNGGSRLAPGIQTPPGMRVNMAAHWYPPRKAGFSQALLDRFRHLLPPTLGGLPLHSLNGKVASFKYESGDRFTRHVDGLFPGSAANAEGTGVEAVPGVQSGLSVLLYLSGAEDGVVGGATRLWSADAHRSVDVQPQKGRALVFRRGSDDAVLHAGLAVGAGAPKTVALINVNYGRGDTGQAAAA